MEATETEPAGGLRGNRVMRGILFAALGGICWGFSGTCAQLMTSGMGVPVSWITCVRLLLGAVLFLVVCAIREPRNLAAVMRDTRSLLRIAAFSLLGVLLTQISYLTAISYTNAGTGTVLERLGLVLIMLYVCLRARRLPRIREFFGLVLAIAGTFLIATKGNFGSLAIPAEGLFWGLVSAFALACYTLIPGKVLEKWGSFIVTGLAMLLGGSVATIAVHPWTIPVTVDAPLVVAMGAMVIVGTFAAYLFYLQGITDAGPVRAGLVGCVEPVSATVISAVWLGTQVTLVDIVGCALIIIMVFLVTQREDDDADAPTEELPLFEGRASVLGYYTTRKAQAGDYAVVKGLIDGGHVALAELGIEEGSKKYPSARRIRRAIERGAVYLVILSKETAGRDEEISAGEHDDAPRAIGVFAVDSLGDKQYARSHGADWLTESADPPKGESTYAALHWVNVAADARRCGVGSYILGAAESIAKKAGKKSVRADIYCENAPMRSLLLEYGFSSCGDIIIYDSLDREKHRSIFEYAW